MTIFSMTSARVHKPANQFLSKLVMENLLPIHKSKDLVIQICHRKLVVKLRLNTKLTVFNYVYLVP